MICLHHGGPNGASLRLLIMLEELGIDYVAAPVNLTIMEHWARPHRALAADGAVPVLVDGERILADSAIALLYLAEAHPETGMLSSDAFDRYRTQASIDTLDAALLDSIDLIGWHRATSTAERQAYLRALADIPERVPAAGWSAVWSDAEADLVARATDKARDGLAAIEAALSAAPWLSGEAYGAADISAFALVRTAPDLMPADLPRHPRLTDWLARIAGRPAVQRALTRAGEEPAHAPPR